MKIGVAAETKPDEGRTALTPSGAAALASSGHDVLIETGAGRGSFITDDEYEAAGASIADQARQVWAEADLMVKVKEPQPGELDLLSDGQILMSFLHLAAYPKVAEALLRAGTTSVAFETVRLPGGAIPILAPMSEVAGRMAAQVGARFLERSGGGRGVLLGGAPGAAPAKVAVIGGGMAGANACQITAGMGADVTVFDLSAAALRSLDRIYRGRVTTLAANRADVRRAALESDLVIGAVLLPGAKAPRVLTAEDIRDMKPGSVVVDIAIDQGGCFETSRETSHSDPTYVLDGVVHYAVGNIPAAVPRTATYALANAVLPYLQLVADLGLDAAADRRPELALGVNTRSGRIVNEAVRTALGG